MTFEQKLGLNEVEVMGPAEEKGIWTEGKARVNIPRQEYALRVQGREGPVWVERWREEVSTRR